MKTKTRILSEKIKAITGETLIKIHRMSFAYVEMGLFKTRLEALEYMLEISKQNHGA